MVAKRHFITREDIAKANTAMIQGKRADFSALPSSVIRIIQENKLSADEILRAFAKARRAVEADVAEGL
jgi:hypothetical protein